MECYAGIEGRNCLIRGCNSDPDTGAVPRLNYERWTWKNLEFNAEAFPGSLMTCGVVYVLLLEPNGPYWTDIILYTGICDRGFCEIFKDHDGRKQDQHYKNRNYNSGMSLQVL